MRETGFELKIGSVFQIGGINHFVSQLSPKVKQIVLCSSQSDVAVPMGIDRFYEGIKTGEYIALNHQGDTQDAALQVLTDDSLSDVAKSEYEKRKRAVEIVDDLRAKGNTVEGAIRLASIEISEGSENGKKLSDRTVRRWYENFKKHGHSALVPRHKNKGRTKTKLSEEIEELISKVMYENKHVARYTVKDIRNLVLFQQEKEGIQGTISYARVRDVVIHLPWTWRHVNKFEPKLQRAIASFGVESYLVQYPKQRVEMDFCKLPIFALFKRGGIPVEVWASVAIDVATGHILAVYLTMRPPNSIDTLMTVQKAVYGLSDEEFDDAGVVNRFKCVGSITEIVTDNGSEYRAEAFSNVTKLGLKVTYCPGYSPYRKPFVERSIGALKHFIGGLPGSTVNRADPSKSDTDRGKREAVIPFVELQKMVNRFIFDDYALRKMHRHELAMVLLNDTYGLTPTNRMQNMLDEFTLNPPFSESSFRLARMTESESSLQKYGIRHETLDYSSEELQGLYAHIGISTKSLVVPDKLKFLYDPLDVRTILVTNPITGKKIAAHLKYKLSFAMSFDQFKEARAHANEALKSDSTKAIEHAFRMKILQSVETLQGEAVAPKNSKTRRKDATAVAKAKTAAAQTSLEEKTVSSEKPALPAPEGAVSTLSFSGVTPAPRVRRGDKA